jgi:hypothetical protein
VNSWPAGRSSGFDHYAGAVCHRFPEADCRPSAATSREIEIGCAMDKIAPIVRPCERLPDPAKLARAARARLFTQHID